MSEIDFYTNEEMLEEMRKLKQWNDEHYEKTRKRRLGLIGTYGCQMNYLSMI